ncbi:hypothetical protein HYPGJ_20582 [Hyphomicrobium sp. GJ21]|nr:hypothetical protein HYPGJ_20582 [Hyphomicrobium sp. GJ21]
MCSMLLKARSTISPPGATQQSPGNNLYAKNIRRLASMLISKARFSDILRLGPEQHFFPRHCLMRVPPQRENWEWKSFAPAGMPYGVARVRPWITHRERRGMKGMESVDGV